MSNTKKDKTIVSLDLEGLGFREMAQAAELLNSYADNPPHFLLYGGSGLSLCWNSESDMMWLQTEDFDIGVFEEIEEGKKRIVQFYSCINCGYEGTQKQALAEGKDFEKYDGYCSKECTGEDDSEQED